MAEKSKGELEKEVAELDRTIASQTQMDKLQKKAINEYKNKIEQLEKIIENSEKKKANLEKDIFSLTDKQKDLQGKVDKLDALISSEVQKATKSAVEKVNTLEVETKAAKDKAVRDSNILAGKIANQEAKIKDAEKLKSNLQENIKIYEGKIAETLAYKSKLDGIANFIKEGLQ
jgi:chromosome segregation ATPase